MNQNCASYTFIVVIDKNLPGEIYTSVQTMFSELVVFVTPFLIVASQYLNKHFVDGVEYCGWVCKRVDSYFQQHIYPALVYAYLCTCDFFFENVYPHIDKRVVGVVVGAFVVFYFALVFGRWLYMRRLRAKTANEIDQIMQRIARNGLRDIELIVDVLISEAEKELQNGQTVDDKEGSEEEGSEEEENCDCVSCGGDKGCCEKEVGHGTSCDCDIQINESYVSDSDSEKKDPTYRPEDDGSVYSDSEDSEDSEDEREEELIARALSKRRESIIPENTARRTGRPIRKPVEKLSLKKNPVKKVPSNEDGKHVFDAKAGCYVLNV